MALSAERGRRPGFSREIPDKSGPPSRFVNLSPEGASLLSRGLERSGASGGLGDEQWLFYGVNWAMASSTLITVPITASAPTSQRVCTTI